MSITFRTVKGSPLSHSELDANFSELAARIAAIEAIAMIPPSAISQKTVAVAAGVSTSLAAANQNRRYLAVQNIGASDGYLGVGVAATASGGWKVHAEGGIIFSESGMIYSALNVICPNGVSKFVVLEG